MISVVTLCHERRDYVIDAVRSVLAQSHSRLGFEVIVVKGFHSSSLEQLLDSQGVLHSTVEGPRTGPRVAAGLDLARGEFIAFLDDDDLFLPGKINRLANLISDFPGFAYYHNQRRAIPRGSIPLEPPGRAVSPGPPPRTQVSIDFDPARVIHRASSEGIDRNSSAIVVSRTVCDADPYILTHLNIALDSALFFVALSRGGAFITDRFALTGYRLHDRNSSGGVSADLGAWQLQIQDFIARSVSDYELLRRRL